MWMLSPIPTTKAVAVVSAPPALLASDHLTDVHPPNLDHPSKLSSGCSACCFHPRPLSRPRKPRRPKRCAPYPRLYCGHRRPLLRHDARVGHSLRGGAFKPPRSRLDGSV